MAATLRPAMPEDADLLAQVIDLAGEGLPAALWAGMAGPEGDPMAVGRARARRDQGAFSWRNATVAELDGRPVGAIVTYPIGPAPEPPGPDTPPVIAQLMALEALAPETRYVNAVAVVGPARRMGVARALMDSVPPGPRGTSLIVTDTNTGARAFYARLGFAETARRPVHPGPWRTEACDWLLLIRPA